MNKSLRNLVLASLAMLALAPAAQALHPQAAHAETPAASLSIGMSGPSVSALQTNLNTLGYYTYPSITGYFGTVTAQSVKDFQSAYGLGVDGIAGPITQQNIARALVKRNLVADSASYIGIPYKWGGSTTAGFDCSGFVSYMFATHGVSIARSTSATMYTWGTPVAQDKLMPGDLVFYSLNMDGQVSHVGIYVGNGQFISALSSKGIYTQSLGNSYWAPKYMGAKRIF
ncbi:C40 family peptidase [Tumebacillus flagellatus]|uniref:Hydrolase Nlp/P60 n=1 Tax=Tumebacillus flagellatus TaxID=1157490 RepID=A0A074M893_9BACL|nr:C40 family peptidase [Tumebacillus flagellatus]KEO82197.1 hydrolase Nlp/P60 [Tumebacillus flagellatus]